VDPGVATRIVDALAGADPDGVVEIGPGKGALTDILARQGMGPACLLEKDRNLARELALRHPGYLVVETDALKWPWQALDSRPGLGILGNLPYNIASPLMWDVFSRSRRFSRAVFMIQYEVAARIMAPPHTKTYGGLSVWLRSWTVPRLLFRVPPSVFRPRPRVDSAVMAFEPVPAPPKSPESLARLVHMCFQKRRKQMGTILKDHWTADLKRWFDTNDLDRRSRPENLTPRHFQELSILLQLPLIS
jgi:16S rRNA (adenine1518-N6/adenine1519-N6)-dimethyltransferase